MNNFIMDILKDIGVPVSFQVYKGEETKYITFFQYNGQNEEYSDDETERYGYYYQIDIWSKEDYIELENNVKEVFKTKWVRLLDEADLYEEDTKIYHKGIRVYIPKFINEGGK